MTRSSVSRPAWVSVAWLKSNDTSWSRNSSSADVTFTLDVAVRPCASVQVIVMVCAPVDSVRVNDAPVPMSPSRLELQRADDAMLPCSGSVQVPAKFIGPAMDAPLAGDVMPATGGVFAGTGSGVGVGGVIGCGVGVGAAGGGAAGGGGGGGAGAAS